MIHKLDITSFSLGDKVQVPYAPLTGWLCATCSVGLIPAGARPAFHALCLFLGPSDLRGNYSYLPLDLAALWPELHPCSLLRRPIGAENNFLCCERVAFQTLLPGLRVLGKVNNPGLTRPSCGGTFKALCSITALPINDLESNELLASVPWGRPPASFAPIFKIVT